MTEVCVAVGTLGAATDQSSCKTNLTLTNPPAPPATPSPPSKPSAPHSQVRPARHRTHKSSQTKHV